MKRKKKLFLIVEFIAVPILYITSAVLLLLLAVLLFLYFFSKDPIVETETTQLPVNPITQTGLQSPINNSDPPKEPYAPIAPVPEEDQKAPPLIISSIKESCGKPWKAGRKRKKIKEATIKKVEYVPQPGTNLNELHLNVETADQQNFTVHVSPEYKINRCPNLFTFQEGEMITAVGFELLGDQADICATELIRQNTEILKLRDQATGKYNDSIFTHEICKNELPPRMYTCWQSWKTPLREIEGTIRKVDYRKPPGGYYAGLHLDIETADHQDVVVHVFPELKISQCPDLFPFQEKETVTVIGSEFSTPKKEKNICAAEIIQQNSEVPELRLRDPITGDHNNMAFNNKICIDEDELKRASTFNWMKAFLTYPESCNNCVDELAMWKNAEGILASCKDCSGYIAMIPRVYIRPNSIAICWKNCSSALCSDPNKMPPMCMKNCMEECGMRTGDATIKLTTGMKKWDQELQKNYPDLREVIRHWEARRANLLLLSFLL